MISPENEPLIEGTNEKGASSLPILLLSLLLIVAIAGGIWYYLNPPGSTTDSLNQPVLVKQPTAKNTIDSVTIGVKSAPLGFYGQKSVEYETPTFNFNSNIYEGLTTFTKDLKFASKQLVESWDNPSDTVWRLRLRKGVKFHNGDDFTAEDAKYSIDFGKTYVVSDDLAKVKEVRIVDPYTIEVETDGPSPLLLNNLINVFVLPKKYTTANGFDKPVGTGPYKFVSNTATEYKLVANDQYYLGAPQIKNVTYQVIEDNTARIDALLAGKVDLAEDVPATRIADIRSSNTAEFKGVPSLRVIFLGFNIAADKLNSSSESTNPFKKLQVRQAVYKAINEDGIITTLMGGHAYAASQPTTSVNFGYNQTITRPAYDVEGAKKLLSDAGFPNGFSITLDVPNNRYQNDAAIGQDVATQLAKVGIKVTLSAKPKDEHFAKVLDDKKSDFYLLGWSQENGDAGGAYATLLHTPNDKGYGSFNVGGYSNKALDGIIENSDKTIDTVRRLQILQELAKTAMDDTPLIPLHQQEDSFGVSKKLNWTPRRDNGIRAFEIAPK